MDDVPSVDQEPPSVSRRRGFRPDPPVRTRPNGRPGYSQVPAGRRGRLSRDDYARQVCAVMRHDAFKLEECAALGQMPGVQVLARRLEKSVFPTGLAIRTLLDRSLHEVEMVALHQKDTASEHMAMFLHLYRQGETVTLIADALGLSRSYVVHHVQRRALDLVARRFLEIAERVEVSA